MAKKKQRPPLVTPVVKPSLAAPLLPFADDGVVYSQCFQVRFFSGYFFQHLFELVWFDAGEHQIVND